MKPWARWGLYYFFQILSWGMVLGVVYWVGSLYAPLPFATPLRTFYLARAEPTGGPSMTPIPFGRMGIELMVCLGGLGTIMLASLRKGRKGV